MARRTHRWPPEGRRGREIGRPIRPRRSGETGRNVGDDRCAAAVGSKGAVMVAEPTTVERTDEASSPSGHAHAEPEILTGAEITCRCLEAEGVTTVFGYPGGAVIPRYDALPRSNLHHVLSRFEQWSA